MDAITLAEVVDGVRGLLDDDQADETLIAQAANWFQDEVCNNNKFRFMEESDTISVAQGDTTADFPDDFQSILNLYVVSPSVSNIFDQYLNYGDFMSSYANFAVASQAAVGTWTDYGNAMRFAAPANAATTLQLDYMKKPEHVVADSDEFVIPRNYEEILYNGTKARIMEIDEDFDEAAQIRQNMEPLMTTFIRNETRGQIKVGPNIMRTARRGGPYRADKDF